MKKLIFLLTLFLSTSLFVSCGVYCQERYGEGYEDGFDEGRECGFFDGIDYAQEEVFFQLYSTTALSDNHIYATEGEKISTSDFNIVFSTQAKDDTVHITCDLTLKKQTIEEAYLDKSFFFAAYVCDQNNNRIEVLYDSIFFDYASMNTGESWEEFVKAKKATATFDTYLSRNEWKKLDSVIVSNGNIYLVTFIKAKQ